VDVAQAGEVDDGDGGDGGDDDAAAAVVGHSAMRARVVLVEH
jgi:hypothetical protein